MNNAFHITKIGFKNKKERHFIILYTYKKSLELISLAHFKHFTKNQKLKYLGKRNIKISFWLFKLIVFKRTIFYKLGRQFRCLL